MPTLLLKILIPSMCLIALFSCSEETIEDITPEANEDIIVDYIALGDSYTIGEGVDQTESWPFQLKESLADSAIIVDQIKVIATTGWTTGNLLNAINNNDFSNFGNNRLVSLLIGVNNQFQNRSFEEFKSELDQLFNEAFALAQDSSRFFVVSIPDYGVTPFGSNNRDKIATDIDMYNDHIALRCEDAGIPFINITDISRDLGDSNEALASDRLHPSGFQYGLWVERILPVAIDLIK